MKKIIFLICFISLYVNYLHAQFSFQYTPTDSIYTNVGGWSLKKLYSQKDSTGNPDSYFIKFYHPNIQFFRFQSTTNNGTPTSIVWFNSSGYLKRSPIDSLKLGYINLPFTSNTFITSSSTNTLTNKSGNISQWSNDIGYLTSSYVSSINNGVSRPVNGTTYTISTTKQVFVAYNIKISCTATIGSSSDGKVALQYSTNSGSTWIDCGEVENSNTVTLAIALNAISIQSGVIVAYIPANALVRMNSTTTGTTTITYIRGQETY